MSVMSFSLEQAPIAFATPWGDWRLFKGGPRTPFAIGFAFATAWSQSLKTNQCLPSITPFANPNATTREYWFSSGEEAWFGGLA